jgi:hypothetical protein
MRADIPQDVAALLEQLDRRIEESRALRVELQEKRAERRAKEESVRRGDGADKSTKL